MLLTELAALVPAALKAMLVGIGQAVAALHDGGLVHGDLTTSNMLVREADSAVVSMSPHLVVKLPGHRRAAAQPLLPMQLLHVHTFCSVRETNALVSTALHSSDVCSRASQIAQCSTVLHDHAVWPRTCCGVAVLAIAMGQA